MKTLISLVFLSISITSFGQDQAPPLERGDFIHLKVANNSLSLINTYIEGPKKNGKNFSYGQTFGPYISLDKYWSIGTKIYLKQNGLEVEIYEVQASDVDQIVDISKRARIKRSLSKK